MPTSEVLRAQPFIESLTAGRHEITSRRVEGGYNGSAENRNWHLATGGYVRWGTGKLTAGRTCRRHARLVKHLSFFAVVVCSALACFRGVEIKR